MKQYTSITDYDKSLFLLESVVQEMKPLVLHLYSQKFYHLRAHMVTYRKKKNYINKRDKVNENFMIFCTRDTFIFEAFISSYSGLVAGTQPIQICQHMSLLSFTCISFYYNIKKYIISIISIRFCSESKVMTMRKNPGDGGQWAVDMHVATQRFLHVALQKPLMKSCQTNRRT